MAPGGLRPTLLVLLFLVGYTTASSGFRILQLSSMQQLAVRSSPAPVPSVALIPSASAPSSRLPRRIAPAHSPAQAPPAASPITPTSEEWESLAPSQGEASAPTSPAPSPSLSPALAAPSPVDEDLDDDETDISPSPINNNPAEEEDDDNDDDNSPSPAAPPSVFAPSRAPASAFAPAPAPSQRKSSKSSGLSSEAWAGIICGALLLAVVGIVFKFLHTTRKSNIHSSSLRQH